MKRVLREGQDFSNVRILYTLVVALSGWESEVQQRNGFSDFRFEEKVPQCNAVALPLSNLVLQATKVKTEMSKLKYLK